MNGADAGDLHETADSAAKNEALFDDRADARDDEAIIPRFRWLTPRTITYGTFFWMLLFAVGSIGVANPFFTETSADADINTWNVMYLHGLLIGMVGIAMLLALSVFHLRWRHAWLLIPLGVVVATLLDTVGGIFDRNIPGTTGDQVAMWVQIIGFFALDEILIVAVLAFFLDWRGKTDSSRRLSFYTGWVATASMLIAAVMGHAAGWILSFGDSPHFIGTFAHFEGEAVSDLEANLIGSHSHDMVVAFMVLVVAASVAFFGERREHERFANVRRVGLWAALVGTVAFTVIYVAGGFTSWPTPTLFQSHNGVNGLASDDLATGFAMFGGLIALLGVLFSRTTRSLASLAAAVWGWLLTVGMVVATGYWIEFHEVHFGAGGKAPGAKADAIFTWFHQDVGLLLFPLLTLIMVVSARYVIPRHQGPIALVAVVGSTLLYAAGMVYVFADQTIHGPGYALGTIGLALIGAAFLGTIWWGCACRIPRVAKLGTRLAHIATGALR